MAASPEFRNRVRAGRLRLGWSQGELAARAGLSRAGVGAIESGRLVPSTAAALALAAAMGCRVEDLFQIGGGGDAGPAWAWAPRPGDDRAWLAEVGGVERLYPVEPTALGAIPHDEAAPGPGRVDPSRTLVVAGCDPAVGLLAAELAAASGVRLLALPRPSRSALALLGRGLVHAAGVHLGRSDDPEGNAGAVRSGLGPGYSLIRLADWEEGIAVAPGLGLGSASAVVAARLRWVGREAGSGARGCLDEVLGGRPAPRRLASDHRGVAEAIRSGWADAGVCLRLAGAEAGLDFLTVRSEAYDLCVPTRWEDDPRVEALLKAARSPRYRRSIAVLPGYDAGASGGLRRIS